MKRSTLYGLFGKAFSSLSVVALILVGSSSLMAQEDIEEVTVTGSRIEDANVNSSSQISVVDIEAIDNRGLTRVEDYLNLSLIHI